MIDGKEVFYWETEKLPEEKGRYLINIIYFDISTNIVERSGIRIAFWTGSTFFDGSDIETAPFISVGVNNYKVKIVAWMLVKPYMDIGEYVE